MGWTPFEASWHSTIDGYGAAEPLPLSFRTPADAWGYGAVSDVFEMTAAGALALDVEAQAGRIGFFLTDADCGQALSLKVAIHGERHWVPLRVKTAGAYRVAICNFDDEGRTGAGIVHAAKWAQGAAYGRDETRWIDEQQLRLLDPSSLDARWRAIGHG